MKISSYLKFFIAFFILGFLFSFKDDLFINYSTYFMPKEYKIVKKLVNKIASKNYLGDREIPFYIGSGSYMEVRAKELGFRDKDNG